MTGSKTRKRIIRVKESALVAGTDMVLFSVFNPLSLSVCTYASGFSVYSGHQSILVPPLELESNASLWLAAVSQYKVRVTFCSYSVMEMCTKGLGSQTEALRVSLSPSGVDCCHCGGNKLQHFIPQTSYSLSLW